MGASREFLLFEVGTRKPLGTVSLFEPAMPGQLLLRLRHDEIQVEAAATQPAVAGTPSVADARSSRTSRKKPA